MHRTGGKNPSYHVIIVVILPAPYPLPNPQQSNRPWHIVLYFNEWIAYNFAISVHWLQTLKRSPIKPVSRLVELSMKFLDEIKLPWWLDLFMDAEVGARLTHWDLKNCSMFKETRTRPSFFQVVLVTLGQSWYNSSLSEKKISLIWIRLYSTQHRPMRQFMIIITWKNTAQNHARQFECRRSTLMKMTYK